MKTKHSIPKILLSIFVLVLFSTAMTAQTVYRVNNNSNLSNSSATPPNSYDDVDDAIAAASNGDIIYLEPSPSSYGTILLSKSLTFIGNGYYLDGANNGNANLQENTNLSTVTQFYLNAGSEGSTFIGLNVTRFYFNSIATNANITIEKCRITDANSALYSPSNNILNNITVKKCYFSNTSTINIFDNSSYTLNNLSIENCIFNGRLDARPSSSSTNLVFRNNTVAGQFDGIGLYVANNIFLSSSNSSFNTCVVRNNVFVANQPGITTGPLSTNGNNLIGQTLTDIIVNAGSADGQYQLAVGSPAIDGGVEIGGVKPDCGAFGGPDPYVLSGIPDIPTIYEFSLPNGNSVPAGTTTIDIDFSTRSNN